MLNRFLILKLLALIWLVMQPVSLLAEYHKNVLVFTTYGEKFAQTYQGIKDDLGDDFKIIKKIIEPETSIPNIKNHIDNINPRLIVLIGNTAARLYTNYQKQYSQRTFPPSMVMSALYVDRILKQMQNTQGIRHEIPAVTSLSSIRSLVKQPIKRVGVLYRKWMYNYIQLNSYFCQQEGIELVTVEIPNRISVKKLNYHLKHLLKRNLDALWVVNDNTLIKSQLIQNVWLPNIKQFNKPVIVGVEGLISTSLNFGLFSVVPDQYALGIQGAGLIGDILDEGIKQLKQRKVYEPISVKKSLNLNLMQKHNIPVKQAKLETLDELIR